MTAAAADRRINSRELGRIIEYRMAAVKIYHGTIVRLNATGFAIPGDDAANGTMAIGVAIETVDNSGGSAGDLSIKVQKGSFMFVNDGNVVQATTGLNATILDDQTVSVAGTTTNDHIAGTVEDFNDDGSQVLIKFHEHA